MSPSAGRRTLGYVLACLVGGPLAVVAGLTFGFNPVEWAASRPLVHRENDFVGAGSCRPCHLDQFASWQRTYHRTMTQRATPQTVRGAFDGRPVAYAGRTARPFERDGRYWIELPSDEGRREAEVVLAVGSRRYQQYFERVEVSDGFIFRRLPVLWHIAERRWLHLNAIFLRPDDEDWGQHLGRWNDNCIFCHNTGPRPGEIDFWGAQGDWNRKFDSRVAELGIACESCHGPGAAHVATYRKPLRRYLDYARGDNDAQIVDPRDLDPERAVSICGQCHGQRLPMDMQQTVEWLTEGPTFRSGDRLVEHVRPVDHETPSIAEGSPDLFRLRFWADGTPRLTAYEYQGVVDSPCYRQGSMSCESCHAMHGGDPEGMIEPAMRGNPACLQCHTAIARDVKAHTHHEAAGSGSTCMSCHMPRMVYGILEIHRSHRIENPDPRRDAAAGRPHACTTCHLDRSLVWSADRMAEWWGAAYARPETRADGAPPDLPDSLASMMAGDAVQRAVYAWAAGRPDSALPAERKAFLRIGLAATLADGYPSIRWMARRSLLSLEDELPLGLDSSLADWDHQDFKTREEMARRMFDAIARQAPGHLLPPEPGRLVDGEFRPDLPAMRALWALQQDRIISIGE